MQKANNNTGLSVWPWWSGSELQLVQFPRVGPRGHCNPKGPAIGLVACSIVSLGGFGLLLWQRSQVVLWPLSAGKYLSTCSLWMCKDFWRAGGCVNLFGGCVKLFGELVEGEGQEMGDLLIISLSLGSCCYGKDQYILLFVYTDPNFDSKRQ